MAEAPLPPNITLALVVCLSGSNYDDLDGVKNRRGKGRAVWSAFAAAVAAVINGGGGPFSSCSYSPSPAPANRVPIGRDRTIARRGKARSRWDGS